MRGVREFLQRLRVKLISGKNSVRARKLNSFACHCHETPAPLGMTFQILVSGMSLRMRWPQKSFSRRRKEEPQARRFAEDTRSIHRKFCGECLFPRKMPATFPGGDGEKYAVDFPRPMTPTASKSHCFNVGAGSKSQPQPTPSTKRSSPQTGIPKSSIWE